MVTLQVMLDRHIRFTSSRDLPATFRRAIRDELTVPNFPPAVAKGAPPTVALYTHNPFNGEVELPRNFWPRLLELAAEHGVDLQAVDVRPDDRPVIQRALATRVRDLADGFNILRQLVAGQLPAAWMDVHIQVTVTRYQHRPSEEPDDEPLDRRWKQEIRDRADLGEVAAGGGSAASGPDPAGAGPDHLRGGALPPLPEPRRPHHSG